MLMLCIVSSTFAQKKDEVRIGGGVYDSFTNVGLPAFVTILNSDSVVVDTVTCRTNSGYSFFDIYIPKQSGEYIMKADFPGYKSKTIRHTFDFSKNQAGYGFPRLMLKRLATAEDSIRSIGLEEVVVRGTRLQVAYRGDTLVYDAQAFNIPEGAMLDALVRKLPGAEMKTNGDIYINGKRLDYITLNGDDFFKGNNKVILENLPYFVVKELKVYHKDPPFALQKPETDEAKDYVLDVVMKREYARGYIANAEVGAGTADRWKTRTFGLHYNDYSRIALFANLNNVNENRTPGSDGDWSPKKQSRGQLTTKQVGLNVNYNNKKKTFQLDQSATLEWSDDNTSSNGHSETFASSGSIFGGSNSVSRMKDFIIKDNTKFNLRMKNIWIHSNHNLNYVSGRALNSNTDSTYQHCLINTDNFLSQSERREMYGNGMLGFSFNTKHPHSLSLYVNYSFRNSWRDRTHVLRNISYINTGMHDGRNDYSDNTYKKYRYSVSGSYGYRFSQRMRLHYDLTYEQTGDGRDNDYYRFYQYGGRYTDELILPSTVDSLQAALDIDNTYNYFILGRSVRNNMNLVYNWKNTSFIARVAHLFTHDRIHYDNTVTDTVAKRNYNIWIPQITIRHKWNRNQFQIEYVGTETQPNLSMLMPRSNTSNPLNKVLTNPNLQSQIRHRINAKLDLKPGGMKPTVWAKYELIKLDRAWGNMVDYNTTTGAYTSIPDNVSGNWNTTFSAGLNGPVDRKKHLFYDITVEAGYVHSVDYNLAYDGAANELSRVNTFKPKTIVKLNYRLRAFSAGIVGKFAGNFSHEEQYGERDMNVREYQIGFNTQYTVPFIKLTIGTDINLFAQNGYRSQAMNTNDWVWNILVSRPFIKGRMVAKVECYDILHQLSARSYRINAQSRVETYYNSIPHYVMFSIGYNFAKKPKK